MSTSLVVMQPTSLCNLNCSYCYVPERRSKATMTEETLASFFRVFFNSDLAKECRIVWHAGEPLAAGKGFYRTMFAIQDRHNHAGRPVDHWIQTNGTLIDDAWCELFRDHRIRISLSLDGPQHIHDRHRRDWSGRGSFAKAVRALDYLKAWGIEYQVLSVLTRHALDYAEEYFHFFLDRGVEHVGFNIEELNVQTRGSSMVASEDSADRAELTARYRSFIATLFELWKLHYQRIEIRELSQMYDVVNEKAKNLRFRRVAEEHVGMDVLNVKKNGDVSTFSPELIEGNDGDPNAFVLGNVDGIARFEELKQTAKYRSMEAEVHAGMEKCRRTCAYFDFCGGGHLSAKYFENGTFDCTETYYCRLHRQHLADVVLDSLASSS
jgi:uncharacterized protein